MTDRKSRTGAPVLIMALAAIMLLNVSIAQATTLKTQNLTRLISDSQSIIAGTVTTVTDGFDESGLPYTEVTIAVNGSAKGTVANETEYTFRQFGLIKPRKMEDGSVLLTVSPAGFARWHEGESVIAFMYRPASRTGLQTTAGLAQGKLTCFDSNTRATNEFGNAGLFDGVWINPALTTPEEKNMLTTPGAVDVELFMTLVHRAVDQRWIENGEMR